MCARHRNVCKPNICFMSSTLKVKLKRKKTKLLKFIIYDAFAVYAILYKDSYPYLKSLKLYMEYPTITAESVLNHIFIPVYAIYLNN